MLSLYLAGPSAELPRVLRYAAALEHSGLIKITHNWWSDPAELGRDRELDIDEQRVRAMDCMRGIWRAHIVWVLWPDAQHSEGVPFECGAAEQIRMDTAGFDKRLVVVTGSRSHESIFTALADFRDASDDVGLHEILKLAGAASLLSVMP